MPFELVLDARVAADIADAERAVTELDAAVSADPRPMPHRLEVLARLLLRAEALGSSQIEGLVVSPRRLALADFDPAFEPASHARAVVGNLEALRDALTLADRPGPVTPRDLCALHARLLAGTRDAHLGGVVRTEQNWIGGRSPLEAVFVPPPPAELPVLLDDLCAYLSGTAHSPLVQAALVHAWFETIHPFADGNGRTGRALIHVALRRRGLCRRFVPPVSLVLATWSSRYVDALMGTRAAGKEAVQQGVLAWIELLAEATRTSTAQAARYDEDVTALVEAWRARVAALGRPPRADAAVWALLPLLPASPLLTAASATALTGRSARAIDGAIDQLVAAGVLRQVRGRVRHRVYEAIGVFDLVTDAERALAAVPRRDRPV